MKGREEEEAAKSARPRRTRSLVLPAEHGHLATLDQIQGKAGPTILGRGVGCAFDCPVAASPGLTADLPPDDPAASGARLRHQAVRLTA